MSSGKPTGKRTFGRPVYRWDEEYNLKGQVSVRGIGLIRIIGEGP